MRRSRLASVGFTGVFVFAVAACATSGSDTVPPGGDQDAGNTSCDAQHLVCGTACIDPKADGNNCGGCGVACKPSEDCSTGKCCPKGTIVCGGKCVDPKVDAGHCGGCNTACQGGKICAAGVCSCVAGETDCSGTCANLQQDPSHCGTCTTVCPVGPPPSVCDQGACSTSCSAGLSVCGQSCVDETKDPANCGGCTQACPARPNAIASCTAGPPPDCAWACNSGYVDLNGDLNAKPRGANSDGCECHVTGAVDKPDLGFVDTNCDGIDGDITKAIFVSTARGDDTAAGTMARPVKTLAKAIQLANQASPKKDVYAALGTYNESVTMVDGVSIYGGYDDTNKWARAMGNTTTIQGGSTAVLANALQTDQEEIQLFTVRASVGAGAGASSYGIRVVNQKAGTAFVIRGATVVASDANTGVSGGSGQKGGDGGNGGNGSTGGAGGGGTSPCGLGGGGGGPAVSGSNDGNGGGPGGGPAPGQGGSGASGHGSCGGAGTHGNTAPDNATAGGFLNDGGNAGAAPAAGVLASDGTYLAPFSSGGTNGSPGSGGGGGGSGSGDSSLCGFFSCCDATSGGGGGGGAGGCAGTAGGGAGGGGASFSIVAETSAIVVDHCTLNAGRGGDGGNGGNGGLGGNFGSGGNGGPSGGQTAGGGAAGKNGSRGGHAGSGAGAPGGPSICIVYTAGFTPTLNTYSCTRGGPGRGGAGGSNAALGQAPSGANGSSVDTATM